MNKTLHILRHCYRETKGAVMVEFAVACLVFCLIIAGIIDLGHAFYIRHVVTNASREGARYGVAYRADGDNNRIPPTSLSPDIPSYLKDGYLKKSTLPSDANPQVTVSGAGAITGNFGDPLEVTVSATKTWFVLDNFIPTLGEQATLSATTVMRCE